MRTRPSRRA